MSPDDSSAVVRFEPADREVTVRRGTYLTAAVVRAGIHIVHDCDGQGVCSTCRVRILQGAESLGPIDARERRQLGSAVERGWRLCCLLRVGGNLTLCVPTGGFAYPPELQRDG